MNAAESVRDLKRRNKDQAGAIGAMAKIYQRDVGDLLQLLRQIFYDAQAQDVLFEWWPLIAERLEQHKSLLPASIQQPPTTQETAP